jgi:hypothetical protein
LWLRRTRAGIALFEEVVVALELLYNIDTGIDSAESLQTQGNWRKSLRTTHTIPQSHNRRKPFAHEVDEEEEKIRAQPLSGTIPPEIIDAKQNSSWQEHKPNTHPETTGTRRNQSLTTTDGRASEADKSATGELGQG